MVSAVRTQHPKTANNDHDASRVQCNFDDNNVLGIVVQTTAKVKLSSCFGNPSIYLYLEEHGEQYNRLAMHHKTGDTPTRATNLIALLILWRPKLVAAANVPTILAPQQQNLPEISFGAERYMTTIEAG